LWTCQQVGDAVTQGDRKNEENDDRIKHAGSVWALARSGSRPLDGPQIEAKSPGLEVIHV
jgi:hypothetical protein